MQVGDLAKSIYSVRQLMPRSQILLAPNAGEPEAPRGIVLLKPSSGHIGQAAISAILERLINFHGYRICAVAWWTGPDIRSEKVVADHYPGFHRVAHGGLPALSEAARERLVAAYSPEARGSAFEEAFGTPFKVELVQTPYDWMRQGLPPQVLNMLWETAGTGKSRSVQLVQRLDEDTFALAVQLPRTREIPPRLHGQVTVIINGFFGELEQDFEERGCVSLWIEKRSAESTSWDNLRNQYAGKTNPFSAPPGSIRGDAASGILEVERVSILANVIHLSATESEGRREVEEVWWKPERVRAVFHD